MSKTIPDNSASPKGPIHVLTFDGGGVRGLSSLLFARDLMERLGVKKGLPNAVNLRPSECFDLIVGTGTGGISALFLGRLRMTVDEAIDEYLRLAETAFSPTSSNPFALLAWNQAPALDGRALEHAIGEIVEKILGDHDVPLEDERTNSTVCHTAVLAVTSENADAPPYVFRSYTVTQPASQFPIHAVARATVSTAQLFTPVSLGTPPIRFIDAGLAGYNNPAAIALDEAATLWPGREISLVSLGTGLQKIVGVGKGWEQVAEACTTIMHGCEQVHDRVYRAMRDKGLAYFRLNVERGLDMDVMEWNQAGPQGNLAGITDAFMRSAEIRDRLDACVRVLNGEEPVSIHASSLQQSVGQYLPLLNPPPEIFHGREKYVEQATNMLLQNKPARLAILGPGGIGKTSIALAVLHDPRIEANFGEHRRFVSCEGVTSAVALVDTLCLAFALHNHSVNRKQDLLLSLIKTYRDRPLLLVLDNFETIWDVQHTQSEADDLLHALGQIAMLSLVLTMRGSKRPTRLFWTPPLLPLVGPLPAKAAYDTFTAISGQDSGKLGELLYAVDHVPLAVTLMAHLGQTETAGQLLERWNTEQTQLLSQPHDQTRLDNVEVSIRLSLESHRMQSNPDALVLLSVIALLPAGAFKEDLAAITPNISGRSSAAAILVDVGLAYWDGVWTLHVLAPIRSYIMQYHPPSPDHLHALESFHFQLAAMGKKHLGDDDYDATVATLTHAELNIEAVLAKALQEGQSDPRPPLQAALYWTNFLYWTRPRSHIIKLAIRLSQQTNRHANQMQCLWSAAEIEEWFGNYQLASEMFSEAREGFLGIGEKLKAANCLRSLGDIQRMLNNYTKAQEILIQAQGEFQILGEKHGRAQCLQLLGKIQSLLSNYKEAQGLLTEAIVEFQSLGGKLGEAQCLHSLGNVEHMLGNCKKAQEMLTVAGGLFQGLGERSQEAQCLLSLGNVQRTLNNYKEAQEMLMEARKEFQGLGEQLGAAQCLKSLGEVQHVLNKCKEAQEILTEAQEEFQSLGEKLGAAQCLRSLGDIQYLLKNYQEAQTKLTEARQQFQELGEKLGATQCLQLLGDVQHKLGDYKAAQDMLTSAREMFQHLGVQLGATQCLQSLGNIQYALKEYKKAQEMLTLAQHDFNGFKDQLGAAQCLKSLGIIQQQLKNHKEAQEIFTLARKEFQGFGGKLEAAQCLQRLGNIQHTLESYKEAQDILTLAQREYHEFGDSLGDAQCLQSLGNIQHTLNNYKEAQKLLTEARHKFQVIGSQLGAAQCIQALGKLQFLLDNSQEACRILTTTREEFLGIGELLGAAQCLWSLGYISQTNAKPRDAHAYLAQAKKEFEHLGLWLQPDQDECRKALTKLELECDPEYGLSCMSLSE